MANPVITETTKDGWALIAENVQGGILHSLDSTPNYRWTYRDPGEAAPTTASEGAPVFNENPEWKLPESKKRDYYIYSEGAPGKVRYDDLPATSDVFIQDQTTPWGDFYALQPIGVPTTLTADTVIDEYTIQVASVANISIGDYIGIFTGVAGGEKKQFATVLNIATLTLTLDTQIDRIFPAGTGTVLAFLRDMNVDGSVTPQVFEIQAGGVEGDLEIDISRIMIKCYTNDPVALNKFGDIVGGLTRGFVCRVKENGTFSTKWNVKDNGDLAHLAYDWTPYVASNPNQGQNGFLLRFSLNGPDKHGVPQRIKANINTLRFIVQDDLTGFVQLRVLAANQEVD